MLIEGLHCLLKCNHYRELLNVTLANGGTDLLMAYTSVRLQRHPISDDVKKYYTVRFM